MGKLLIAWMVVASSLALRADILVNGDFSQGMDHWKGDASPVDPALSGIMVNLDGSKWTKVYQEFNTRENELSFSITYQTSPDCAFAPTKKKINKDIGEIVGLKLKKGKAIDLPKDEWVLIFVDLAKNLVTSFSIKPVLGATGMQTVTGKVPRLAEYENKTLYLAFPPGQGSVTLSNISLTPVGGSADQ